MMNFKDTIQNSLLDQTKELAQLMNPEMNDKHP